MDKRELRRVMRQRRLGCDPAVGVRMARFVLASGLIEDGAVVAGFWPLPGEIDPRAVLLALVEREHVVALPVTPPVGRALSFRRWQPGASMQPGRFGTVEPVGELVAPDVLLMPLLAFDRLGGRLGYGGGYYDRTLERLGDRAIAIGCGFATQEVDRVPTETHDRPMDAIATEDGVIIVE